MGCKLYLMDLTSAFCAPLPGEEGDTQELIHTKQSSMETLGGAHIHLTYPTPVPPPCNIHTWCSCLCSKFNYPLIDTSQGYLRCRHERWFPRRATGSSLCPNTPHPPASSSSNAFSPGCHTHTHTFTHQNKHICTSQPLGPACACSRGVLINRQSVKNHSLKSLKGFTPRLWLAGKENPMNS